MMMVLVVVGFVGMVRYSMIGSALVGSNERTKQHTPMSSLQSIKN